MDLLRRHSRSELKRLLAGMGDDDLFELVRHADPDDTADILQALPQERHAKILNRLEEHIREKVEFLLRFRPESAAGMMNLDYVLVEKDATYAQVKKHMMHHEKLYGTLPLVLVHDGGVLRGHIPASRLFTSRAAEKIAARIRPIPTIRYDASFEQVVEIFSQHEHGKVVVLEDEVVLGIINADDVLRILPRDPNGSLTAFAGVAEEEGIRDAMWSKVHHRYRWLIVNIGHAFLAALVIGMFEETISALVLLAVYMPIVAGMGGNAATQTLAVVVRGLALRGFDAQTSRTFILREMTAGGINGVITGAIIAIVAFILSGNIVLSLVLFAAMVFTMMLSGLVGAITPLFLHRIGRDPATSATIFITTATDVFGFFIFLGLASLVLI